MNTTQNTKNQNPNENPILAELEKAYLAALDNVGHEEALDRAYYEVQPHNDDMEAFKAKLAAKLAEE